MRHVFFIALAFFLIIISLLGNVNGQEVIASDSLFIQNLEVIDSGCDSVGNYFIEWEWDVGFENRTPPINVRFRLWDEDGDEITPSSGAGYLIGSSCASSPRPKDKWRQEVDWGRCGAVNFGPGEKHAIRVQVYEYNIHTSYKAHAVSGLVWGTTTEPSSGVGEVAGNSIRSYQLSQNYPNPFNPTTTVEFAVPNAGEVTLTIFNTTGQTITTLYNGYMDAGYHKINWNAAVNSAGLYFLEMRSGEYTKLIKMTLVK